MIQADSKTSAIISLAGGFLFAGIAVSCIWPYPSRSIEGLHVAWPNTVECGKKEVVVVTVPVENRFATRVVITGGRTSCYCGSLLDLPLELPPGANQAFRISFNRSSSDPPFALEVELYVSGQAYANSPHVIEFR